ncbi:MAG: hypothetical protein A2Y12_19385 [Planctomycetes bacterium GWF2_42_9]|nr:MAG: hypothetical protein A2Y12_19385 [Planctomycetes bacterium GWF2_42_9]HAL45662.1 hypothetical protein [Phycisphaerales bacterium]
MSKQTKIIGIKLENLLFHPENPNKMSKTNFAKLKLHIKESHNYEPIIVRKHPAREGFFEILNGHHRCEALKQLGESSADCVVWNVNDDEARILLTTLNRLGGKDELKMKMQIIKKLSQKYNAKDLSRLLPDAKATIEKLKNITKSMADFKVNRKAFLNSLVFFLDDEQLKIVQSAIDKAMPAKGTKAEKSAAALTLIANAWTSKK